ncbi:MAG: hypothetical protein ACXWQO_04465, partial [Bdellovibrionota bacterium]
MPKLGLYLLLLGMAFSSLPAYSTEEKDCGEIRLDQGKGPFADMPVYNQLAFADKGDTEICFAVTASQLIDANRFYREGKLPAQLSAPVSIALTTKLKSLAWNEADFIAKDAPKESVISTGILMNALKYGRMFPVCDQNWLNNFEGSFGAAAAHPFPTEVDAKIYGLYPSKRNFLRAVSAEINNYTDIPLPFLAGIFGGKGEPKITEEFFECRIEENLLPVKDLLKAIKAAADYGSPLAQMNEFMKHFCAGHSFTPDVPAAQYLDRGELMAKGDRDMEPYRTEAMEIKVHELLAATPLAKPVAISFCGSAMKKRGEGELRDDRMGFFHDGGCITHSAVVVGRKFNPNSK